MTNPSQQEAIRNRAEEIFRDELLALAEEDRLPRPGNWRLSPRAVVDFICGCTLADRRQISPKYFGNRRLIEIAVATLATDRALLLTGKPGTAKTWVSEHLAAAISGDSGKVVQGTAGTDEAHLKYNWNYALMLLKGPVEEAMIPSPVMKAMQSGSLVRIEELTRIPSDVQDSLISTLSEKNIQIPETGMEVRAIQGFNVIATANTLDKGVNELSSALKRRFNIVQLPFPDSVQEEVKIVNYRIHPILEQYRSVTSHDAVKEIERVITIFHELRKGGTLDGKNQLKTPDSSLSTGEAISLMQNCIMLAVHFGDGKLSPRDIASGLTGAIVKNPEKDLNIWKEYLEIAMKAREHWKDLYLSCKEQISMISP